MQRACVFAALSICSLGLGAEEGMWRPRQLPELRQTLRDLGLKIDPSTLSDLTSQPMNAVIWLGGCTASFVSPQGLAITNHHCAYGSIQHNSTADVNLLRDGFLAADPSEELPAAPGTRILVTVAVDDVTGEVLQAVPEGASGLARYEAIENREKELIAACERDVGHRCSVRAYFGGLEYELIKQLEIRDVRLVYAPAGAIGVYGGDIDNWMWPRHTGDFSFYRAYVGPDGKPADPGEANVPYRPRHLLTVSTQGLQAGDFVMAAGYPGTTNRYRLASEVANVIDWYYPTRMQAFSEWLQIIETWTTEREGAKIKYASLVAGLNNAIKNYEGMLTGFGKSDVLERKQKLERGLQLWIDGDPGRAGYRTAIADFDALAQEQQAIQERRLYYDYLARRPELIGAARTLYRLSREGQKPDIEREPGYQERDLQRIEERLRRIDTTYEPEVDRAIWRRFIVNTARLPAAQRVAAFDSWFGIQGDTVDGERLDARLNDMYERTGLGNLETRLAWMHRQPSAFEASDDPFIQLAVALYDSDLELERQNKDLVGRLKETRPRYMTALKAYLRSLGRPIYPDANSTLRVTYGTVKGYSPQDALVYAPFTTLTGLLEKETGEEPFSSPPALLAAIRERDFGSYRDAALDSVAVNFLSDLDSTGGNSGSPTLNARGELVGLLFDGNWESIIADWDFIPAVTRAIHVDMRYVLWIMERIDDAGHLLREMGIEP
jgi:hypothetical protein